MLKVWDNVAWPLVWLFADACMNWKPHRRHEYIKYHHWRGKEILTGVARAGCRPCFGTSPPHIQVREVSSRVATFLFLLWVVLEARFEVLRLKLLIENKLWANNGWRRKDKDELCKATCSSSLNASKSGCTGDQPARGRSFDQCSRGSVRLG